ncbi:MAG: PKD domain-containing protein [Bacteroidota bacterium]
MQYRCKQFGIYSLVISVIVLFSGYGALAQTSFTVSASTGCKPMNVQFTNTTSGATSFVWDFGNGSGSTQANPSNIYIASGVYTVILTTSGSSGTSSSTTTITVVNGPVANFHAASTSACQSSGIVQFVNTSTSFDSCVWDFGDGTTTQVTSPSHIYSLPGLFTVTLVVYDRADGCSNSISKNQYINVMPLPTAVISVNDSVSCSSSHVFQFTGTGNNINNWHWDFGDGTTSSLQNPAHIYNDTGYFDVHVTITGLSGCADTLKKNHFIHILYNPVPAITVFDLQGCIPFNTSFSTAPAGISSYLWNLGDGHTDSLSSAYHTYVTAGSFNVTLTVHYNNGCINQNSAGTVVANDIPSFTYTIANYNGCAPLAVQFINNNAGAGYNWVWNFGDGDSSTVAVPQHTYTADGLYTVSLFASNAGGCSWGYPLSAKVKVSSPQALFNPDKTTGCAPLAVNFNNQSINAVSYLWDFGDGTTSVTLNPTHIYNNAGIYIISLVATNSNGCTDTMVSSPVNVTAGGNSFNPLSPVSACAPFTINFEDNSSSSAWLWNFGDGTTSTLSDPSHTYTQPGTYIVSLTTTGVNGTCSQNISNLRTVIINGGVANFTHVEALCPPYIGTFTDSSTNAVAWNWDFGDGGTSNLQNPAHLFSYPGYHTVGLTITTSQGCKVSTVKNLEVYFEPLLAATSAVVTDTLLPMSVNFYSNTTGATYWLWTFGDGDSSTLEDPLHIYTTAGPYNISLTIGNDSCSRTYNYPPQKFGMGANNPGGGNVIGITPPIIYYCAPYRVEFNSPYPDAVSWYWFFGDGDTSTLENPVHSYITSGIFQPTLIAGFTGGTFDTLLINEFYHVDAFDGHFDVNATGTCTGLEVTLIPSDTTANCSWELGDGNNSTASVPHYIYPFVHLNYLITLLATDSNGCVASSTQTFYASDPNPVGVSTTRSCAGDTVFFENTGSHYSAYLWEFGDGDSSILENPFHIYSDSGIYYVTLTVFDSTGCSRNFVMNSYVQVFKPEANFNVSSLQSSCSYVTAFLNNQSTGYDYLLWDFGNGQTSSQPITATSYYLPGSYTITLTVTKSVCSSSYSWSVPVVMPALNADFNFTQTTFCAPVQQPFNDASTDAVSWLWNFGDGTTDTIPNPVHTYITQPTGNVYLIVKDIYGCAKSISKPNVRISKALFTVNATSGCIPFTAVFDDSSSNVISWHWSFGDGGISTLANPVHVYNSTGVFDVELIIVSDSGCTDTLLMNDFIQSGNITASFTVDSTIGCAPLIAQFTDNSTNAVSWLWNFGDGGYSNLQHPAHIYNVPGIYQVILVAYDSLGCADSLVMPSSIIINGSIPMFTASATNGCMPVIINFSNQSTGAVSYEWNFGNGVTDNSFEPTYQYLTGGSYVVSLTTMDSSGCESVYTLPGTVEVSETPVAIFSYVDSTGCTPFTPAITNKSLYADSLVWDFGDGTLSTDVNPVHTYTLPGTYYISLHVYNLSGCSDSLINQGPFMIGATPDASFFANDSTGCMPVGIQFTNTSSNLFNPVYYWDFGNGDTSTSANPYEIYSAVGTYDVKLMVTNGGGCYDKYFANGLITVFDQNPPPPATMYTVSVSDTGGIDVSWRLMNLNDIDYYTLYRLNNSNGVYDSAGSYFVTNSSTALMPALNDAAVNTDLQPYTYKVLAVDQCGNKVDLTKVEEHTSVFLSGVNNNHAISLSWTPYGGCDVSGYYIYRSDAATNSFQLVGTVDSSTLFYTDLTTYCPFIYHYKVEAISVCGEVNATAFSNTIAVDHTSYQWQQTMELTRATVVNNSYVLVEWMAPSVMSQTVIGYDIFRSSDHVNFTPLSRVGGSQLYYEDHSAEINDQNYYYKVTPVNYCDVINSLSNEGSSILLKGIYDQNGKTRLRWTSYSNWSTNVDYYILEKMNDFGVWEQLKTTNGTTNEADD